MGLRTGILTLGVLVAATLGGCGWQWPGSDDAGPRPDPHAAERDRLERELLSATVELAELEAADPDGRLSDIHHRQQVLSGRLVDLQRQLAEAQAKKAELLRAVDAGTFEGDGEATWADRVSAVSLLIDEAEVRCVQHERELVALREREAAVRAELAHRNAVATRVERLREQLDALDAEPATQGRG